MPRVYFPTSWLSDKPGHCVLDSEKITWLDFVDMAVSVLTSFLLGLAKLIFNAGGVGRQNSIFGPIRSPHIYIFCRVSMSHDPLILSTQPCFRTEPAEQKNDLGKITLGNAAVNNVPEAKPHRVISPEGHSKELHAFRASIDHA